MSFSVLLFQRDNKIVKYKQDMHQLWNPEQINPNHQEFEDIEEWDEDE